MDTSTNPSFFSLFTDTVESGVIKMRPSAPSAGTVSIRNLTNISTWVCIIQSKAAEMTVVEQLSETEYNHTIQ